MVEHQVGLTETYNRLKDPTCTEPAIESLRALEAFEDKVIDRLFLLNAERAGDEKLRGGEGGKKKSGARKSKKRRSDASTLDLFEEER